ncbi:MAG: hypothetical protein R3B09_25825 [Nannocystaceae bacterium]
MLGDRDRPGTPAKPAWIALAACLVALACPSTPSTEAPAGRPDPASQAKEPTPVRTANPDRRGFDNQPDYEGEAASLREYVDARLPSPLPRDRAAACAGMFAAVDRFYEAVEYASEARRREVTEALAQSREADAAACERETSPKAAACVTVLLGDRTAEFPWLLDQCSRAYPPTPA